MYHQLRTTTTRALFIACFVVLLLVHRGKGDEQSVDAVNYATCSADIYPINVFTVPVYKCTWKIGLIGQYNESTSTSASVIRFAVDYINANTNLLPNCSILLYEADVGNGTDTVQATTIASIAEIMLEGVQGLVGGNSLAIMQNCAQACTDFSIPHIGSLAQDAALSVKSTYPYMLRGISPYSEQSNVLYQLMSYFNWYKGTLVATTDSYGNDAGSYVLSSTVLKGANFKFTEQTVSGTFSDFPTKAKNMYTALQTVKIILMFTQPATGFPFISYLRNYINVNGTLPGVGDGIVYILSQAMCAPILSGSTQYAQYYPLIDGSLCIYPRGGDTQTPFYTQMSQLFQQSNETIYPRPTEPSSFDWYGVDSVFAHAYAINSLIKSGKSYSQISGSTYLKALASVSFNGTTGPFAFDTNYDRRGIWDIYNNVYDSTTGLLSVNWMGEYRWDRTALTVSNPNFVFFGGSTVVPPANVTKPVSNTTTPTVAPTKAPTQTRKFTDYSSTLSAVMGAITGACVVVALFAALMLAFKWSSFQSHGPFYCAVIITGVLVAYASALATVQKPTDNLCMAFPWLLGIGFNLVYGCLFIKTWVLYGVFRKAAQLKKTKLTPFYILKILAAFLAVEVILLVVWTVVDPPKVREINFENNTYGYQCGNDSNTFWVIFLTYKGAWLIFGAILAFLTRNIASEYNESKSIAYSIYVDIVLLIVAVPLATSIQNTNGGVVVIEVVVICIAFTFTMIGLFSKIWKAILFGKLENVDSKMNTPSYSTDYSRDQRPSRVTDAQTVSTSGLYLA
jgi:hypothetical protein